MFRKIKKLFSKKNSSSFNYDKFSDMKVFRDLNKNIELLKHIFEKTDDVVYREVLVGKGSTPAVIVYISNIADTKYISDNIVKLLLNNSNIHIEHTRVSLNSIKDRLLSASDVEDSKNYNELLYSLLSGDSLLFLQNSDHALIISSKGIKTRETGEASTERTLRGPQESFVEKVEYNIGLVRMRIRNPNLAVEFYKVGNLTQTKVVLMYLKDMQKIGTAEEIRNRIKKIDTNSITASAQIEQLIEDHKWSLFPQTMATDRPDKISGSIIEGRVAVIVDGTPFALIAPVTLSMFLNSTDDYFERAIVTSMIRFLRYISFFSASTLPALFLAVIAFHPGMLPTSLVLYLTNTRIGLPFPIFVEIILMQFTLEILVESAVRLPKPIGPTISIVGGLVIGQAVVQAGLVSPLVVIIVSFTAVSTFTLPIYTFALSNRAIRIPMILASATLGLYGVVMMWLFILIHMASIKSFGVRYLEDFSPYSLAKLKDTIFKVPEAYMSASPQYLQNKNSKKLQNNGDISEGKTE